MGQTLVNLQKPWEIFTTFFDLWGKICIVETGGKIYCLIQAYYYSRMNHKMESQDKCESLLHCYSLGKIICYALNHSDKLHFASSRFVHAGALLIYMQMIIQRLLSGFVPLIAIRYRFHQNLQ